MSRQQGELSRDASALIDSWLAGSVHHNFEDWDVPRVLQALEPQLYDAWEHGRNEERRTLLSLKEALLSYLESLLPPVEMYEGQALVAVTMAIQKVEQLIRATVSVLKFSPFRQKGKSVV